MNFRSAKARWARKLLMAKYFVLLTDKESVIALDGADPNTITDALALSAQAAEVEMFYDKLGKLVKEHQDALKKLGGDNAPVHKSNVPNTKAGTKDKAQVRANSGKKV